MKKNSNPVNASSSSSKTGSISKYFRHGKKSSKDETNSEPPVTKLKARIFCNDPASDDDFRSPMVVRKRNNLANTKQKAKSKNTRKKKKPIKNHTIEIVKQNFNCGGENAEHLQMAIALSKSTYEVDYGHSFVDGFLKEETPDISKILQNAKSTNLERFGFKTCKPALTVENRRLHGATSELPKRFKHITPILQIRSSEDRESLIASKMSFILGQPALSAKMQAPFSIFSTKLQDIVCKGCSIFHITNIYESNSFYTNTLNLQQDIYKCGSLLKDWSSIPGRDKSPERTTNLTDEKTCVAETSEMPGKCFDQKSPLIVDEPLLKTGSSFSVTTDRASETRLLDHKISDCAIIDKQTVSSSCRSISPDLFGSDDDQYYAYLSDSNKFKDSENNSSKMDTCFSKRDKTTSDSAKPQDNYCKLDRQEHAIFHTDTIDLTGDDAERNNSSDGSFSKPASFYSLEEFEDAENEGAQQSFNESGVHVDLEQKNVGDATSTDLKELNNISSQKNTVKGELSHRIENDPNTTFNEGQSYNYIEVLDDSSFHENSNDDCGNLSSSENAFDLTSLAQKEQRGKISNVQEDKILHSEDEDSVSFIKKLDDSLTDHVADHQVPASDELLDSQYSQVDLQNGLRNSMDKYYLNDHFYTSSIKDTPKNKRYKLPFDEHQVNDLHKSPVSSIMPPKGSQSLSVIEILDDSSLVNEDMPVYSFGENIPGSTGKDCQDPLNNWKENRDSSIEYTPKKGIIVERPSLTISQVNSTPLESNRLTSFGNSNVYNSADLNVTDYVNNLLNREENLVNEEEDLLLLSQNSQNSTVADEELNYSSRFATPARVPMQTMDRLDLIAEENSNESKEELPVNQDEHLENHLLNLEIPTTTKKSVSTPNKYVIKTKNVTPMPDFESMTTPLINRALQEVGIKPLKRARGAKLLKYIYESTHPLVGSVEVMERSDSDDEGKVIKRRKKNCVTSNTENEIKATSSTTACAVEPVSAIDIIGDRILENEKPGDLIFERKRSLRIPSCQVPLQIVWHNYISCNPSIKETILLYEPLQLEALHLMLKNLGFKFNVQDLLTFLDKKCITIRTAQKEGKRHR